jgi:hypothetical protein
MPLRTITLTAAQRAILDQHSAALLAAKERHALVVLNILAAAGITEGCITKMDQGVMTIDVPEGVQDAAVPKNRAARRRAARSK